MFLRVLDMMEAQVIEEENQIQKLLDERFRPNSQVEVVDREGVDASYLRRIDYHWAILKELHDAINKLTEDKEY